MADSEQRSATVVTVQEAPPIEGLDAINAELDRLNSLKAAEEARIKAEEAEQSPPAPWEQSLIALLQYILAALGNPPAAEYQLKQLIRGMGK